MSSLIIIGYILICALNSVHIISNYAFPLRDVLPIPMSSYFYNTDIFPVIHTFIMALARKNEISSSHYNFGVYRIAWSYRYNFSIHKLYIVRYNSLMRHVLDHSKNFGNHVACTSITILFFIPFLLVRMTLLFWCYSRLRLHTLHSFLYGLERH